jgi:hypothetical protein
VGPFSGSRKEVWLHLLLTNCRDIDTKEKLERATTGTKG